MTFFDEEEGDWFTRYQLVVGSAVNHCQFYLTLLRKISLAHYRIFTRCPTDVTFRIHHKSFPDFVTSASRCRAAPKFLIDPTSHNLRLGKQYPQAKYMQSQLD